MDKEYCSHCGASITENTHSLSKGLVASLIKFGEAINMKGENDIHLQTEADFTKNEYNNFQKLRYWGLVHHADRENSKSGRWLLTKLGGKFLRNEIGVSKKIKTLRNKKTAQWEELIFISDFYRFDKDYWRFDKDYWQREFVGGL